MPHFPVRLAGSSRGAGENLIAVTLNCPPTTRVAWTVQKPYYDFQRHAYEKILDNPPRYGRSYRPLDKVFGVHPCWIRDFTPPQ